MPKNPLHQGFFESDVRIGFLALDPLVPQNLLTLRGELGEEAGPFERSAIDQWIAHNFVWGARKNTLVPRAINSSPDKLLGVYPESRVRP